jgi:hypothetical protein
LTQIGANFAPNNTNFTFCFREIRVIRVGKIVSMELEWLKKAAQFD